MTDSRCCVSVAADGWFTVLSYSGLVVSVVVILFILVICCCCCCHMSESPLLIALMGVAALDC